MFVILNEEYFDESMVGSEVIGYYTSYEKAEEYLLNKEYTKDEDTDCFLSEDDCSIYYIKNDEYSYTSYVAIIEELVEIL